MRGRGGVCGFLLARAGEDVVLGLRARLVRRLLRARVPELDRRRVGDLLSRATADPTALRQDLTGGIADLVTGDVADLVTGGIGVVVALVVMAAVDPVLLLLVAGLVLLAALAVRAALGGIRAASTRTQDALGELTADLDRALGAIRTVRASRAEERESARVLAAAHRVHRAGVRVTGLQAVAAPAVQLAVNGSFVVVLLVGGLRVVDGEASVAELVTFLLCLTYLAAPISPVVPALAALHEGAGALRRTSEVLALPVERSGGERGGDVPGAPLLELRDVRLSCGSRTVLDGLSFTVPRRGVVALVGPSGAGESTVFALVERFAEPDSGALLLNGRGASTADTAWCRSRIGLVEQHAPLLHGTLLDNLRDAAQGASEDEVERVLRLTGLHDPVRRLPDGLGTDVGDRGCGPPAGSGSGSRSPARCWRGPNCCCSTSRRPSWTPTPSARWSRRSDRSRASAPRR